MIFWKAQMKQVDEIKYTLYNFYNNFLETIQSLFCITKQIFSLFILILSVSIKLYFRRKKTLTISDRYRQA